MCACDEKGAGGTGGPDGAGGLDSTGCLAGVLEEGDEPPWWLEGSSCPIRILDPEADKEVALSPEKAASVLEMGRGEMEVAGSSTRTCRQAAGHR
ncbi:MAG: hypothetical protein RRA92_11510 [Gemmatimonadota bacterium]|nr:hypothetical protein [Gemmatimonadota bacterium]